ncbi:RagB/SusD family nutrient uptake outer membrane protein [Pedobacter xixiisoli]|uniref:SusD family protein n=1 Tax=Pedobacter xixiisoli TaxID=1476464 RepID=A0A286A755_9SPHI|nr:RagB/SusD family nutrient uptake outer membrane protein [Pedobacter xixiisoli]SOD17719.1 SusD family protein [Pedobacter xixiisoli]
MKRKLIIIYVLTVITAATSCKDFISVGPPTNKLASSTVFLTEETATAAINGLYITLSGTNLYFASGGTTAYLGLYSDELIYTSTNANITEFYNGNLSPTNGLVNFNFWEKPYQIINQANSCIASLKKSSLAPDFTNQLLGEAYFIRAFCYWHLITLFGDVPLVISSTDYEAVTQMTRTPITEVQEQIISDLSTAKGLLKPNYPTTGRYRANYYAVLAFQSRVNTFLGNWPEVLSTSNEVLAQTSIYSLENDLNRAFLIGSSEAIWQTASGNATTNTFEALAFIPLTTASIRPNYAIQTDLYNSFLSTDKRKTNWITSKTVTGTTYRYPYKYKVRPITPKTECQMMIRLAEIFLNRAEAKAHLNDPTAIDDLNKTRNRAGLINLSGLSGQTLIDAVLAERRLELFAEMGLRWFDLKRIRKLDQLIAPIKSEWKSSNALFPIPFNELMAAPKLIQNPGYN